MTSLELRLTLGAFPVGAVACWVWAFLSSPKRRTMVPEPQPAPSPPEPAQGLVRGFAWSLVALTDQFLEVEPTVEREREYVGAVVRGTHVYEEMSQHG